MYKSSKHVSRVLYPYGAATIYLGCQSPGTSCDHTRGWTGHPYPSYLVLLQVGFTKPVSHLTAGALLPHRFILTTA